MSKKTKPKPRRSEAWQKCSTCKGTGEYYIKTHKCNVCNGDGGWYSHDQLLQMCADDLALWLVQPSYQPAIGVDGVRKNLSTALAAFGRCVAGSDDPWNED